MQHKGDDWSQGPHDTLRSNPLGTLAKAIHMKAHLMMHLPLYDSGNNGHQSVPEPSGGARSDGEKYMFKYDVDLMA